MRKTAVFGMLICAALMLSYLESLLPAAPGIPGIKLGLPNLVTVLCLYRYGEKKALLVNLCRILLSALLFSGLSGFLYSVSGALLSFAVMAAGKRKTGLSIIGVSVCGGVFHNVGQLLVVMFVLQSVWIVFYLPWLLFAGCLTGTFIGLCAREVGKRLPALS